MLYAVGTAEIGALLLKCVLIVYIWPEKGVYRLLISAGCLWYCFDWLMPDSRISRVIYFFAMLWREVEKSCISDHVWRRGGSTDVLQWRRDGR